MNAEEKMATAPPPPGHISAAEVAKVRDNYFTVVDGVAKLRCGSKYLYDDLTALLAAADKPMCKTCGGSEQKFIGFQPGSFKGNHIPCPDCKPDAPEPPTLEERARWWDRKGYTSIHPAQSLALALAGDCDDRVRAWLADSAPKGEGEKERE